MPDVEFPLSRAARAKIFIFYTATVAVAAVVFLVIRTAGEGLTAPPGPARAAAAAQAPIASPLFHALVALALILITARALGELFARLGQPPVMGEVVGGIVLGPSLLGHVAPAVYAQLLPDTILPFLGVHAQLGVILYLFLVGLELDPGLLRRCGHATLVISHASIIAPFLLGSALALGLYPVVSSADVPFTAFALFLGVSLSVTAFPVLARILTDRHISRSQMGTVALTCAAIDDATAWCLLAVVLGVAQARASEAIRTVALTITFIGVLLLVVAPLVARLLRWLDSAPDVSRGTLGLALLGMLASAIATEAIGIHGFFGAFLFGAIIPPRSHVAVELHRRLGDVVAILFLPAFFAFTGMRTQIGLISGTGQWLLCALIVLVACLGKFGGTVAASRLVGMPWRDSAALGVLMNTRGLVELIVLNVGLDLQVISPTLFAMLVIMALVTTFMATPFLSLVLRNHPWVERGPAPFDVSVRRAT